jgi:glutamate-1-semialdehyde aminotransferase
MGLYADKKVTHGGTFNGYPLGLYAIGCTLNILEDHKADYYNKAINAAKKLQEIIINGANRHGINLVIQGHPMAMCMHISSKPLSNINDWSVQMKNQEEVIRKAFLREHIFIAPPCRLYPNMSIDDSVLEFVESKMDKIWSSINF